MQPITKPVSLITLIHTSSNNKALDVATTQLIVKPVSLTTLKGISANSRGLDVAVIHYRAHVSDNTFRYIREQYCSGTSNDVTDYKTRVSDTTYRHILKKELFSWVAYLLSYLSSNFTLKQESRLNFDTNPTQFYGKSSNLPVAYYFYTCNCNCEKSTLISVSDK